jgi:uncharacterized protein YigA (DUF484 family)
VTTADTVLQYLQAHPELLRGHPELLSQLQLPDPHGGQALSLHERQAQALRERVRALEERLAELMQIGRDNDLLAQRLLAWSCTLLRRPDEVAADEHLVRSLRDSFGLDLAQVLAWEQATPEQFALLSPLADGQPGPYCGAPPPGLARGELGELWSTMGSAAVVPLGAGAQNPSAGVLLLGARDPGRFGADAGTAVLARVGALASAALGLEGAI